MEPKRELWNEYRRTWEAFARALDGWDNAAPEDRARLHVAMEEARAAHAAARDRLAEELSEPLVSSAAA